MAVGTLPGMLLVAFCFDCGASTRLDREPRIIGLLYDLGMLSFNGSAGLLRHRLSRVCDRDPGGQEQDLPQMACLPDDLADRHRGHSDPDVATDVGPVRLERLDRFWLAIVVFGVWLNCQGLMLKKATDQATRRNPAAGLIARQKHD